MPFYHITPSINLESIKRLGIIPDYSTNGITVRDHAPYGKVFLTDDVDRVYSEQLTEEWIEINSPVNLRIVGLDDAIHRLKFDYRTPVVDSEFQFEYNGTISPKHIMHP